MVEERRWPLGNKITELHGGFGTISTIRWKENLIAWANEKVHENKCTFMFLLSIMCML